MALCGEALHRKHGWDAGGSGDAEDLRDGDAQLAGRRSIAGRVVSGCGDSSIPYETCVGHRSSIHCPSRFGNVTAQASKTSELKMLLQN